MAYRIAYSPENNARYPQVKKTRKNYWGKWVVVTVLILAAAWISQRGIPDIFIPGDPDHTKAATNIMLELIKEGEPVEEALTAFCKEIIDGAQHETNDIR